MINNGVTFRGERRGRGGWEDVQRNYIGVHSIVGWNLVYTNEVRGLRTRLLSCRKRGGNCESKNTESFRVPIIKIDLYGYGRFKRKE